MGPRDTHLPSVLCQRCHQLPLTLMTRQCIGEGKRLWSPINRGSVQAFPLTVDPQIGRPSASRSLRCPVCKVVMRKAPAP